MGCLIMPFLKRYQLNKNQAINIFVMLTLGFSADAWSTNLDFLYEDQKTADELSTKSLADYNAKILNRCTYNYVNNFFRDTKLEAMAQEKRLDPRKISVNRVYTQRFSTGVIRCFMTIYTPKGVCRYEYSERNLLGDETRPFVNKFGGDC